MTDIQKALMAEALELLGFVSAYVSMRCRASACKLTGSKEGLPTLVNSKEDYTVVYTDGKTYSVN